jgi:enoyl-CoA hydratase
MTTAPVLCQRGEDGVVTLTLNRPDQRNALDQATADAFAAALRIVREDPGARALILCGAGPAFCAGGDLALLQELARSEPAESRRRMGRFYRAFLGLIDLEIPSVAAIHGHAMGAGLALTFACDLRVVAREARVGLNFLRLGLSPGMGSTFFLPQLVGPARARELLLSGRAVDGAEAAALGLCHEAVPAGDVVPRARQLALELAAGAPLAVRLTRRCLRRNLAGLEEALEEEAESQARLYPTRDVQEGVAAARERRAPRFEGR